jgi:dipeptide/tripeptide permease
LGEKNEKIQKKKKKKDKKKKGMHCRLLFESTLYWVLVNNDFPISFLKKYKKEKLG